MKKNIRIYPAQPEFEPDPQGNRSECTDLIGVRASEALEADGWTRRHLADPHRAEEAKQLYEEMGFEVLSQVLTPEDFAESCNECASTVCRTYVLIYTRRRK